MDRDGRWLLKIARRDFALCTRKENRLTRIEIRARTFLSAPRRRDNFSFCFSADVFSPVIARGVFPTLANFDVYIGYVHTTRRLFPTGYIYSQKIISRRKPEAYRHTAYNIFFFSFRVLMLCTISGRNNICDFEIDAWNRFKLIRDYWFRNRWRHSIFDTPVKSIHRSRRLQSVLLVLVKLHRSN